MVILRNRQLLIASVALVLAAVALTAQLLEPRWRAKRSRAVLVELRTQWDALMQQPSDESTTYAAVITSADTTAQARVSAAAWGELLAAAGVPQPAMVADSAIAGRPGFRLLVVPAGTVVDVASLVSRGRAVVAVDPGELSPLRGQVATWQLDGMAAVQIPLAGQPGRSLKPGVGEKPVLVSEVGEVLAVLRRTEDGGILHLGLDVAWLLVRLRQGDVTQAVRDRDGNGSLQPADLLPNVGAFAKRPFADELIDAILVLLDGLSVCPFPRTRGLPGPLPIVVLTSDQDYADEEIVRYMAERLALVDAHATFMLTHPSIGGRQDLNRPGIGATLLDTNTASELLAAGHGLGMHPFIVRPSDVVAMSTALAGITGIRALVSRNHHLGWQGYLDVPMAEVQAGIVMDLNFMAVCDGAAPCVSFPGGSARAIRFIGKSGERLPLLQQTTAIDDYSLRAPALRTDADAPSALAAAVTKLSYDTLQMLARAAAVDAPLVVNAHPVFFATHPEWLTPLLREGIHVLSAEQWLDYEVRRRRSKIVSPSCDIAPKVSLEPGIRLRAP